MNFKFLLLSAILFLNYQAWSMPFNPSKPIKYKGVDITKTVKILSRSVKVVDKEFTVYHWDNSGNDGYGPEKIAEAKKMAGVFWSWYGNSKDGSMYGYGLYAAADPLYTNSYGNGKKWSLLQLTIPKESRFVDVDVSNFIYNLKEEDRLELRSISSQFGCGSLEYINDLFSAGGNYISKNCQSLVKKIFQDILLIDGLVYNYGRSSFNNCKSDNRTTIKAFVITNPQIIKADNFIFYSMNSKHNLNERIRIQTLFLPNDETAPDYKVQTIEIPDGYKEGLKNYLRNNPKSVLKETKSICQDQICNIFAIFCTPEDLCKDVFIGSYDQVKQFNAFITTNEAKSRPIGTTPRLSYNGAEYQYLLWADLEGQPKAQDITPWIKDNFYACDGRLPFREEEPESESKDQ